MITTFNAEFIGDGVKGREARLLSQRLTIIILLLSDENLLEKEIRGGTSITII